MDIWYYARNGEQMGPVDKAEIRRLIASGTVKTGDYVWTEGMRDWLPANQVPGMVTSASPDSPSSRDAAGADDADDGGGSIPNYLPWAIFVTLCCCLPGGVASIVYSVQANSHRNSGNWSEARRCAVTARNWLIWSAVLGALASAVSIIIPALQVIMPEIQ